MKKSWVREIWRRAGAGCEYCRMPQRFYPAPFQIDHVIARQHGGATALGNLALSCLHCNGHKGPNIASIDPKRKRLVPLYNPRRQRWERHFRWKGVVIVGRTPVGRATVSALNMNGAYLLGLREALQAEGLYP